MCCVSVPKATVMAVTEIIAIALAARPGRAAIRGVTKTDPVLPSSMGPSGTVTLMDWYIAAMVPDYSKATEQSAGTNQS